jgi:hypothetical protein
MNQRVVTTASTGFSTQSVKSRRERAVGSRQLDIT